MNWKRWFRRTVIGVVVSLTVTTVWLVAKREWHRAGGEREVAAAVAEAAAADPDWTWDRLNAARTRPPDAQNAALLIPRIKAASSKEWGKWAADVQPPSAVPEPASNVRYPQRVLTAVRADLTASAEGVRLARTLKGLPQGQREIALAPNPLGTNIQETQDTRHAADVLRWDLVVALEDGNYPAAADALLAALNVSRSVGDEPFLISQLVRAAARHFAVRAAERAIAQTGRPEQLAALSLPVFQEALARDAEEPLLLYGARGERAVFDILFEKMQDGTIALHDGPIGRQPRGEEKFEFGYWLYMGRLPADRAYTLRWMTGVVEAAKKPVHEQRAAIESLDYPPDDKNHVLSRLLLASLERIASAYWRSVGEARCAVAGIACERFRLKHGRWPNSLAELCPEFLPAVPPDPTDGQPLRYRKLPDGVVVYATTPPPPPVRDDIGVILGPRNDTARPGLPDDVKIGFRLWNPEARRQPPPAEPVEEKP